VLFDELREIFWPYSAATPNLDPRKFTTVEEPVHRRTADSQCIDNVLDREQLGSRGRDRVFDWAVVCSGRTHHSNIRGSDPQRDSRDKFSSIYRGAL
jgi:hypothetical protein